MAMVKSGELVVFDGDGVWMTTTTWTNWAPEER